ncbi:MAG: hypothetical protein OEW00_05465 [candidate division Zixibacteria bacterium]|nr:hypothetical protein [candidate division Zixibacteria bacterium]
MVISISAADVISETDPVLDFYLDRAGAVFASRDPVETGITYSFTATSYYKNVSHDGSVGKIDSAAVVYFFSFGQLDSQKTIYETADRFQAVDFSVPNVFRDEYLFSFFPNDTGGSELTIGFDSDSVESPAPVGLAVIDRERYTLRQLLLYYPHQKGHRRYSRTLRFVDFEGRIFPDSMAVVGAKYGVFSTDHYRLETRVEDFRIQRR